MILYTLAPLMQSVLQAPEQTAPPLAPQSLTCGISGGFVQGVRTPKGMRVTRVISTDPRAYLSKEWDLGAEIETPAGK